MYARMTSRSYPLCCLQLPGLVRRVAELTQELEAVQQVPACHMPRCSSSLANSQSLSALRMIRVQVSGVQMVDVALGESALSTTETVVGVGHASRSEECVKVADEIVRRAILAALEKVPSRHADAELPERALLCESNVTPQRARERASKDIAEEEPAWLSDAAVKVASSAKLPTSDEAHWKSESEIAMLRDQDEGMLVTAIAPDEDDVVQIPQLAAALAQLHYVRAAKCGDRAAFDRLEQLAEFAIAPPVLLRRRDNGHRALMRLSQQPFGRLGALAAA